MTSPTDPPRPGEMGETLVPPERPSATDPQAVDQLTGDQTFNTSWGDKPVQRQTLTAGRRFGDYELLEEVGRGGMGVIFKARQVSLDRLVALKMILAGTYASEDAVERFKAEARAAANLEHPGIVPIYEIGELDGQHFFSMAFIDGGSLQQQLADGPLPPLVAARLVRQVADALDHAHAHGIIHRDIKPHNILLTAEWGARSAEQGEAADLSLRGPHAEHLIPKVSDFGLAKMTQQESGRTASGETMGTPSYMPPEQAAGHSREVGPRSDVYSLGAVLYSLLTGRPPFQAASAMDTLRQVIEQEAVPLRQLNPVVPRDLETIALKCLQKEPARRYASARELADELGRFLDGQLILARPVGTLERAWRWGKRNRAIAIALVAVMLSLTTGAIVSYLFALEAGKRENEAIEARIDADQNAKQARDSAAFAVEQNQLALQALNTLVLEVQDKLRDTPATGALKKKLLASAAQGLEKLSRSADRVDVADPAVVELRNRLGDLYQKLGNTTEARREYESAVKIGLAADRKAPSPTVRLQLARSQASLAALLLGEKDELAARMLARAALALVEPLLEGQNEPEARQVLATALDTLGRGALQRNDPVEAQQHLRRLRDIAQRLFDGEPKSVPLRLSLASARLVLGQAILKAGDRKTAETELEAAVRLVLEQFQKEEANPAVSKAMVDILLATADVVGEFEAIDKVRPVYEKALEIARSWALQDPDDAVARAGTLQSLMRLGALAVKQKQRGEARDYYVSALAPAQFLIENDPGNRQARADLLAIHEQLGRISVDWGAPLGARNHFRDAYGIARKLAAEQPESVPARRRLFSLLVQMSDVSLSLGDLAAARDEGVKALEIGQKLTALQSGDDTLKADLARATFQLAQAWRRLDDLHKAADAFAGAMKLAGTPASSPFPLPSLYRLAANVHMRLDEPAKAEEYCRKLDDWSRTNLTATPDNVQAQVARAEASILLGMCKAEQQQFDEAARLTVEGVEHLRRASQKVKLPPAAIQTLEGYSLLGQAYAVARKALDEPAFAASQPPALARKLLFLRVQALARKGELAAASESAGKLRQLAANDPEVLFESAQAYALIAARATDPERQTHAKQGLEVLRLAVEKGFHKPASLRTESNLAALRQEAGYPDVLRLARSRAQDPDRRLSANSIGMEFLFIPRGKFMMGAEETPAQVVAEFNKGIKSEFKADLFQPEHPQHEVELTRPFHFGATEVTVAQFRAFVESTGYQTEAEREGTGGTGFNPSRDDDTPKKKGFHWKRPTFPLLSEHQPVVLVSWNDAVAFCKWLSQKEGATYRLPTEAEWEYACRAGSQTRFWFGDDRMKLINYANVPDLVYKTSIEIDGKRMGYETATGSDGYLNTALAGEYLPNPWGLFDTHGNVWEWCQDGWDPKAYEKHAKQDPLIPPDTTGVIRGGCFM